jgi:hypothetical protein
MTKTALHEPDVIAETLQATLAVLYRANIPHFVCGGLAVFEHGYRRYTHDVDLLVPQHRLAQAEAYLLNDPRFRRRTENEKITLTYQPTGVDVDLFPGGQRFYPASLLPLPEPLSVSKHPLILPLNSLMEMKISCYEDYSRRIHAGYLAEYGRVWVPRWTPPMSDADLVEILKARMPSREIADDLDPAVRSLFVEIYDKAQLGIESDAAWKAGMERILDEEEKPLRD